MKKKKILIVDDEESLVRVYKLLIENTGKYEVWKETKGAKAFSTAKKFMPDLILLDIMMPDVDGGTVAAQLKEDEDTKDIPVVFVSAAITKEEEKNEEGIIKGGYPILAKPVPMDKLLEAIEKYTNNSSGSDMKDGPSKETEQADQRKERRKHKRVKTVSLLSYECIDKNNILIERGMGRILDISQGGLYIETPNLIDSEKILLSTNDIKEDLVDVEGKVIYSERTGHETFRTGVEFHVNDEKARKFVVELIRVFNVQKNR